MRLVVFSDVHLHHWRHVSVSNQVLALYQVLDYCTENRIETLLFCGDFFHTHGKLHADLVSHFHYWLRTVQERGLRLITIAGNHDFADRSGAINGLGAINLLSKGTLLSGPDTPAVEVDGVPFYGITYQDDASDLLWRLETVPTDAIVLLHQGVSGVELNSKGFTLNEALTPAMIPSRILHAFSGHYHTTNYVSHNLTIPGALIQHTWQDAPDVRGFLDVTLDGKRVHLRHVPSTWGDNFRVLSYEKYLETPVAELQGVLNVKVLGVPNEAEAARIQMSTVARVGGMVFTEVQAATQVVPADFAESGLSSRALFDQYVATRNLSTTYTEIGKRIVEGKSA